MAQEAAENKGIELRPRSRSAQMLIYLGKFTRIFIFQNDWKVLPMAAIIAGMVSLVVRGDFFITMEGTLKGALALTCVSIWNGFFNSIQVICRERSIIKREHRSGMHVTSYVCAHLLFQAVLCLAQTAITLYIISVAGVKIPREGFMTNHLVLDLGITIFLITYSSDILALFVSSLVHTTTTAMTVMPFLLIFQLVFSGGIFSVPERLSFLTDLTVSGYGMQCIAAQADYNSLPMMSGWASLRRMKNVEIEGNVIPAELIAGFTERQDGAAAKVLDAEAADGVTVRQVLEAALEDPSLAPLLEEKMHYGFTVGEVLELAGEDTVKHALTEKGRIGAQTEAYARTKANVINCWMSLVLIGVLCALGTIVALEFIDRDRR